MIQRSAQPIRERKAGRAAASRVPVRAAIDAPDVATSFECGATAIMEQVAKATRALVRAVPGDARTAAELERNLGVTKKVAWQLHKIAESRDAVSAAGFMPGADPVRKLLVAAERRRVPAKIRHAVGEAFQAFEAFVDAHAGDRASFLSMLDSMAVAADPDSGADVERLHRRACFRAYSHFMGVQIKTRYSLMVVRKDPAAPSQDTFVSVRARLGLRRLRPDATIALDRYFVTSASDDPSAAPSPRPLDPAAMVQHGAPILPSFCTRPLPRLKTVDEGGGIARIELAERAVGLSGAVDVVLGNITRGVAGPAASNADGKPHGFHTMAKIDMPSALLVMDVLVRAGDYGSITPELYCYADPSAEESKERRERSPLLKCRERIEHLGRGLSSATCGEVPRYTEMLAHLCGGLSWDPEEFDVYRLRVEYPLMHSVLRIAIPSS